ncbi:hypothetical protein [Roseobacter sp.]|uniref:hypothetical protein n=1 Tax=Roseobacter sp. TaxID=1907202 RepID=UPI0029672CE7|nr:hypothetical protein [Roseobacter sp.]MDW3181736.1 hypothetical protein [Roseobacter sp.]
MTTWTGQGRTVFTASGTGITYTSGQSVVLPGPAYLSAATRFGLAANPALTVYAVFRHPALTELDSRVWQLGDDGGNSLAGGVGDTTNYSWRYDGGNRQMGPATVANQWRVIIFHRAADATYGEGNIRLSGTPLTENSVGNPTGVPTNVADLLTLGGYVVGLDAQEQLEFAEFGVLNANDTALHERIEGYTSWKWGTPV